MNQYLPDWQPSKSCFVRLRLATECRHLSVISRRLWGARRLSRHPSSTHFSRMATVKEKRPIERLLDSYWTRRFPYRSGSKNPLPYPFLHRLTKVDTCLYFLHEPN